eukprot:TCALIF_01741-PA protein Name:"Similar to Troponin C, isoform 1 (Balanus nubilus)" AED:0.22 eAED:0.24 QI:0/0.33/0.5/1/1/1/4/0/279
MVTLTDEEVTGLALEQIEALKKAFEGFDKEQSGIISGTAMQMIFKMMGVNVQKNQLDEALGEIGTSSDEGGKFDFQNFCIVASKFLIEEDEEQMREELKEAFRIYDKEGNGYITTDVLKEILHEIDPELTHDDLDGIVEEVDEDGSGTLDFDAFQDRDNYQTTYHKDHRSFSRDEQLAATFWSHERVQRPWLQLNPAITTGTNFKLQHREPTLKDENRIHPTEAQLSTLPHYLQPLLSLEKSEIQTSYQNPFRAPTFYFDETNRRRQDTPDHLQKTFIA